MRKDYILSDKEVVFQTMVRSDRVLKEYQKEFDMGQDELGGLNGKETLLVGGGVSPIREELIRAGVKARVTNIDPYASFEAGKRCDDFVRENFLTHEVKDDKYDETWALWSLPAYCETIGEVRKFYAKALLGAAPRGKLRVAPVDVSVSTKLSDWQGAWQMPLALNGNLLEDAFGDFMRGVRENSDCEIKGKSFHYQHYLAATITLPERKRELNKWLKSVERESLLKKCVVAQI